MSKLLLAALAATLLLTSCGLLGRTAGTATRTLQTVGRTIGM